MRITKYICKITPIIILINFMVLAGCDSNDPQSPELSAPIISDLVGGNEIEVDEGTSVAFQLTAIDLDSDQLEFSWDRLNLPETAEFTDNGDGTAEFSWETNFDDNGFYQPIFTVTDGSLTGSITITITVINVNRAPSINDLNESNALLLDEGDFGTFRLTAEDMDGDALSFEFDLGGLPEGATFTDNGDGTTDFSWQTGFSDAGNYSPVFTVSDGELTDELTISIVVGDVNRAPIWESPDPNEAITGDENEEVTFEVSGSDPDGDAITITLSEAGGLPEEAEFVDSQDGTGIFRWTPGNNGEGHYTPTFTVSDGDLETSVTLEIAIGDVNLAPVWESPDPSEPIILLEGEELSLNIIVSDPDSDPVVISMTDRSGLPDVVEFVDNGDNTGTFIWLTNGTDAGEYNPIFTLSDGEAERTVLLTIQVQNLNRRPEIDDINEGNSFEVAGGDIVEFILSSNDADGDDLTYSANMVNLPEPAVFVDNGDGSASFSWESSPDDVGTYEPTFSVSDDIMMDEITVLITITQPDTLPLFSFFVTSLASMQELSGSMDGFGGDLRYGETGAGAGLRGADKICMEIAEMSMPGAAAKDWVAFLSVTDGGDGNAVNAIDRIGEGPWYDRHGRMVAPNTQALAGDIRPQEGNPTIRGDLPNEWGVPNHRPDPNEPLQPNHHTLTGSFTDGTLYPNSCADDENSDFRNCFDECIEGGEMTFEECLVECADDCITPISSTCLDWTTSEGDNGEPIQLHLSRSLWASFGSPGRPRIGLSWERAENTQSWVNHFSEVGCAPGGIITPSRRNTNIPSVGFGGGYGGIYCFGRNP